MKSRGLPRLTLIWSHLTALLQIEQLPAITALKAIVPIELMRTLPAHTGGCFALAFDRGGTRLATCGADKTVKLWDSSGHHTNTLHVSLSA